MDAAIYLVQNSGELVEMTVQGYDSEVVLQDLLARYPHLLAGAQIDEENPRHWLLIGREVGIAWESGGGDQLSLDHLFVDQDGIPTLVEVKRSTDTRIRREVVGQMLEYAANAVLYWPVEKLRAQFELTANKRGADASQVLAEFLGTPADDVAAMESFWQEVKANLQAGKIRMLFVADEIPMQLRRIIEFLNLQMSPAEVFAIEVKQYAGQGLQTLVPRLLGQTTSKTPGLVEARQWDETTFFQDLEKRCGPEQALVARKILEWAKENKQAIWWGRGKRVGSFVPYLDFNGKRHQVIGVWSNGYVELQFQFLKSRGSLDAARRLELLHRLNNIPNVNLAEDAANLRPNIGLNVLAPPQVLEQFLSVVGWAIAEIQATPM